MVITSTNFILFAAKHYRNPRCLDIKEFHSDLSHIKYVKRLLKKYIKTGVVQERLVLNHLIVFYNMFEIEAAHQMLFYRLDEELWPAAKTYLLFLNLMPEGKYPSVPTDLKIFSALKKL
jgi:hypothetical protein